MRGLRGIERDRSSRRSLSLGDGARPWNTRGVRQIGRFFVTLFFLSMPTLAVAQKDAGPPSDAGPGPGPSPADAGAAPSRKIPPDPPALSEREQWVFDLRWEKGDVYLVQVHKTDMGSPHPTPRVMGRFALQLVDAVMVQPTPESRFAMLSGLKPAHVRRRSGAAAETPMLMDRIG